MPAAALALGLAWRRLPRRAPWLAAVVAAALALDAFVPAGRSAARFAALANASSAGVQHRLSAIASDPRLHRLLYPGGGEAEPEAPFPLIAQGWRSLPFPVDVLVVVDERGQPVAWAGASPRLPLRLRPLGERAVAAEPGIGSVWIWWRESVFESGQPLGAVLAGVEVPERGARSVLGVWAGRAAVAAVHLAGWGRDLSPGPAPATGFEVRPARPVPWSAPGLALLLACVVLVAGGPAWAVGAVAAAAAIAVPLLGWLPRGWWLVGGVAAAALAAGRLPRRWLWRALAAVGAGTIAWALAGLFDLLHAFAPPRSLLWPGVLRWALVAALAVLVRNAARGRRAPWPLAVASWLPLALGVARADPLLIGAGTAVVALFGLSGRGLLWPALIAAGVVTGGGDAARRADLVATTEATLARLANVEAPARSLLASLPQKALADVPRLVAGERLVVLGRLAERAGMRDVLPGTALVLTEPSGEPGGSWGEAAIAGEGVPRELASRALGDGWVVSILAPPAPNEVLAGLGAAGVAAPVAVFDRSGAPTSRGATFRPLPPAVVGRALAAGRGWVRVGVGEREFAAYFHARRDSILVVPWVRPPAAEGALQIAALALWGLFPLAVVERRRRWLAWWAQRRTFSGRMRVLTVAAAVLPVLLLGWLLPQQWDLQQGKSRLEFARAVSQLLASPRWQDGTSWLMRELDGAVAVYRAGRLVSSTRPDLAALGRIPWMPPPEAYVRSVRGWQEPVVTVSGDETSVYAPIGGNEPVVVGVIGLRLQVLGRNPSPGEWFVVTGVLAMLLALVTAERLGQRLGRPLRRLVAAAHRLERGERVAGLDAFGDEDQDVGALGRAFSTMAHEVQRREDELRRSRNFLETVLQTLSAAVVVGDETGGIGLANPAAARLLGEARSIADFAARFAPELGRMVARSKAGERVEDTVHPIASPEALWRVTTLPLPGAGGRVLVVMEDLSELARAERLSSFAELARIAAHEVKNPLTPIRLWAEELKVALAQGPEAVAAVAQVAAPQILERVEHLREVAQGFSNLVALEHWEAQPIALKALAGEVVAEYGVLRQRGVAVRLEGDDAATIVADAQWVRRALRHLLENSARVLTGREGEIVVGVHARGRQVVLAVRDSGGGVAHELLGRLFEPHFSTTSEGSGLGLAVVHRVAVRAGGRVEARNTDGGLEVRLVFPAQP